MRPDLCLPLDRLLKAAGAAITALLLAACGGGGSSNPVAAPAAAIEREGMSVIQAVPLNIAADSSVLVVRAYARLAGDVGAMMTVRVDDVEVGTVEVRATDPEDYRFAVPALKAGSRVDIVYTNDGQVGTTDRNLYVVQLNSGSTYMLPTMPGTSIDRGPGAAAFDGVDVIAGSGNLFSNGALRLTWPEPNLTERLTVRASSTLAGDVGARMIVRVDGVVVGNTEVRAAQPADHVFATPPFTAGSKVDVAFANAETVAGTTRSLQLAYLMAGTTVLRPTASGVVLDLGSGLAAYDNAGTQAAQASLTANGALRAKWPAPNMTDTLTVRASGTLAANVGPIMQVRLDGVVLGNVEVRSTSPVDISLPSLPVKPGSQLDVAFVNDAIVGTEDRKLVVHYAMSGKTVLLPTDAGVSYDLGSGDEAFDGINVVPGRANLGSNGALRGTWPEANLTDSLTVRARGVIAGGTGPIMQVLVDGILVGTAEVRSTTDADYSFATPPMTAGRKVEVFYTNDATVDSVDRNLYLAYLVSGKTFLRPNAAGNVYDRGAGAKAFDGQDLVAASGAMVWGGTLRGTWPAPNITDTVTVRASATLAGNIGAQMILWVDGIAVSSVEVRSTTPTDYLMPTPPLKPGSQVAVTFANPGSVDGVERTLDVAYLIAGGTYLNSTLNGTTASAGRLSGTWPAPNLSDTLVVRMRGVVAGGIGPRMQLMVDGMIVAGAEVTATDDTDHRFAVPPLKPGSKIDIVYINDGQSGGVDRNLYVTQLTSGSTYMLATASGVIFDRGVGAAAFDGVDALQSTGGLFTNGAMRFTWASPNLTDRITARASSVMAGDIGAMMVVRVDGVVVGNVEVRSPTPEDYVFASPPFAPGSKVDVAFTNPGTEGGVTRRLNLAYLKKDTTVLLPSATGVRLDLGIGLAAYDGLDVLPGQGVLSANSALRASWPAPNMTETLTVRASGQLAANVGPVMQVLVDGVVLGKIEVRSATPTDYSLATLPIKPGANIEIAYVNDAVINSEDRNLNVAYAMIGQTVWLPNAATVVFDRGSGAAAFDGQDVAPGQSRVIENGALRGPWPEPNLTDSLVVRARGTLAGDVGPIMQVLVDGIVLGSREVRTTSDADYVFAAPSMSSGRKVDIVYTNDATINGADRNLFVSYLISGKTFLLPTAAGNSFDRGVGAGAFDGVDLMPASGVLAWSGALRTTWPAPNITDSVTVRAIGKPAGGIYPTMVLWVDGVAVSSVDARSTSSADYAMPTPTLKAGNRVAVTFANPGTVDGVQRQLDVAYLLAGSTYLSPSLPGTSIAGGGLAGTWPSPNFSDTLVVRASATLAGNVGALMQVRVDGVIAGTQEVRSTSGADYAFITPRLSPGSRIDVLYINDATVNGQDRNLNVQYVKLSDSTLVPFGGGVVFDAGSGDAALDGVGTTAGSATMAVNGALRFTVPAAGKATSTASQYAASRFLQQATFGPTIAEIDRLSKITAGQWIDEQIALPFVPDMVGAIQAKFDLGSAYRPGGANYSPNWINQRFWASAVTSQDQLRRRMGFALHQIFMISMADSSLHYNVRAYANYLDMLNRNALGNFRTLLQDMALSPAMGIYLSHMRNRPEDIANGRVPDENFAREVMQLFTIGLQELNLDGTPKLGANGAPVESYTTEDVMAMARVFTGWSWGFPDGQLNEATFRWSSPDYSAAGDQRIDLLPMKAYPGMHSTAEKRLFAGRSHMLVIPANTGATDSLRMALDALFNHPNVGPFIGRQLIQHLVTSNPSPGYVARVAAAFNDNGRGVRGDLAAVAKAVLLDAEATTPSASIGKLREPAVRVTHWIRAFDATSASGQYLMLTDLDGLSQRPMFAPSVFGYFRPGYVPPNTQFAASNTTLPEFQIVNEPTTAQWVNLAQRMAGVGLGWTGTTADVLANIQPLVDLVAAGQVDALVERLNLLLFAGRMSVSLKQDLLDAMVNVPGNSLTSHTNRARAALFLALASPEFLVQR